MKEMIQRQKGAVFDLSIELSVKHPLFALLVRHSEWILNHLVRNDFLVELDNRDIKTSPYESHTGNPAPRSTRILVGRRDDDDKQPRSQQAWFLGLVAGSEEVIALHPDGVQRHHGDWRVSPLDDPESNLRELKSALALMTECDRGALGCKTCQDVCKTCQDVRYHKRGTLRNAENEFSLQRYLRRCGALRQRNDCWILVQMTHVMTTSQSNRKVLTTLGRWHMSLPLDLV